MVEVDIGIIPYTLPPIIQLGLVYHWFYLFLFLLEVYIGLIPVTFLPITMLDNTVPTQGSIQMLFLGLYIHLP